MRRRDGLKKGNGNIDAATEHKIKVARIPRCTIGGATSCVGMVLYFMLGLSKKQELEVAVKQGFRSAYRRNSLWEDRLCSWV